MAQVIEVNDKLTGTVSFARKVSDGNYGASDGFMAIQFPIEAGDTAEDIARKANDSYAVAKALVNVQLGLAPEDEGAAALIQRTFGPGVQRETIQPDNVVPINTPAQQVAEVVATDSGVGPNPPFAGSYRNLTKDQNKANSEWAKARFATHPGEFFDNRISGKQSEKSPDIKHKQSGVAAWL